ncbi:MAG: helix-turn-helix domain-containing protein [Rhizomicrobium sp.]
MPRKQSNPIDAHVGSRVRLRRMLIGMSQEKLGELLGLTFQQIQKYEKGANRIAAGRLYQVAHILGVSVGYFYEGILDQSPGASETLQTNAVPPVIEFLSNGEGLQLSLAFMRIEDTDVRKRVLDLVKSLADDGQERAR